MNKEGLARGPKKLESDLPFIHQNTCCSSQQNSTFKSEILKAE